MSNEHKSEILLYIYDLSKGLAKSFSTLLLGRFQFYIILFYFFFRINILNI